ncbi:putative ribonuclease H-like domain-containing protein [Tanacetum coccineum]
MNMKLRSLAARYGYLFSQATAEILCQAEAEIRNQGVSAVRDPAGIDSAVRDPAGIDSAVRDTAGDESAGSPSAGSDPAGGNPADSSQPAGSFEPADESNPAVSSSVSADFIPVYADESTLPPGQSLGSSANTTRFPLPSDVCMDQLSSGIFTSSSYDDDFRATLTNLAPAVEVNPVPTKRVNTIHPQSQILGDLASPVMTRSRAQKSKFGESAFIGYIQNQQRTNHTDQLHCLFGCFLSQLEPTSIAKALEDPDWVAAMQEEMQQFINQQVWKLVPLPDGKHAIGTKWILKNKRDARGIVVRNKARLVAQGHRQEEGIDYDEVFAPVARIEAIRLFLAFASYMGFLVTVETLPDGIFISKDKYVNDMLTKSLTWNLTSCLIYGFNFMNTKIFIDNQSTICIVKNPVFHQRTKHIEIRHHFIRDANEKNLIQVLKSLPADDNVADLLTKAFDGPRFAYLVVHIGMVVNTAARCTFFLLTGLVSAGRTMVLLVVILSAGRLVSAGSTMVLLVAILSAGRLVSAGLLYVSDGSYPFLVYFSLLYAWILLLEDSFCWHEFIHAVELIMPAITSYSALIGLVCAVSIMFLLADLFLLVVTCFCCAQFDIAGWLVSATSHLVSAGSLPLLIKWWRVRKFLLTPPHLLAIAAAGDAADEENAAAHEAAGSTAEAHPTPHSPPPANYIEPEDIDNLISIEDDTILGGFHEESHVGPDDAPTPTADVAGRAEDPALLTSLSAKIDRCMGRIDSLETELGTSKKIMGGAILTLVSRVKKLERTVKQLRTTRLVGDAPAL